ncbi:radical SAM protein [Desulfovibrio aminophilus]|uniref:B12-binding domain-containing radical SAM protein n=1 Tax=Desulfovibrio aminophilus TaxID=81425 RepID=UPI0033982A99
METVLLLNPPGKKRYIRDYFCSKVSKSGYLYPPTDLLLQSGLLARDFRVSALDAVAEGLSAEAVIERIAASRPDHLLTLAGAVSLGEDAEFLARLRRAVPSIRSAIGIGDLFLENPAAALEQFESLDAVAVDFTADGPGRFFAGRDDHGLATRGGGPGAAPARGEFSIPVPRHDLFASPRYRYPFVRRHPFAVVLTNFGCPYRCSFCVMPGLGFKSRAVENVLEELDLLKARGCRDLYFNDQTFGADRPRTRALLEAMIRREYGFGFVCFTRVDLMNREFLLLLRRAGCHTVMFGAESADDALLESYSKNITAGGVMAARAACRELGLRTVATFILGLPGETEESALATIAFAKRLDPDFASFNLAVPRMGTPLRREALDRGYADPESREMDQSGSRASLATESLAAERAEALRNRASREFYLRPGKILGRLLDVRTTVDALNLTRDGLGVMADAARGLWRERKGSGR